MKKIVTGVFIVLAGVFLLIHNLGYFREYYHLVFSWQSLLVAIGVILLFDKKSKNKDGGIILIIVGLAFLTSKIFQVFFSGMFAPINTTGLILSVGLIAIGVFFIINSRRKKQTVLFYKCKNFNSETFESMPFTNISAGDSGFIKRELVFSSSKERFSPCILKKLEIDAVFSGVEIDLSQVELSPDVKNVHIKVSSVFSGVVLYLPPEWNVLIQKTGVFGGFEDRRSEKIISNPTGKQVILELEAVFGGGEIKCYE